jgi:transcriptional regulator with XRE-family HTH domain
MKIFSQRLKELRGDLSQVAAARKIDTNQQSWARYESGNCFPAAPSLITICREFGVSADWLLGLSDRREGGVKTVADPALVAENEALKAETARLQSELLRCHGEIAGLNKAIELLSTKK